MIVSHWGRYSIIYTARRHLGSWQGVARIKPSTGAPDPFSETGSYFSKMTARSEAGAELAIQKEVASLMKQSEIDGQAFDSLVVESKMRTSEQEDFSGDEMFL